MVAITLLVLVGVIALWFVDRSTLSFPGVGSTPSPSATISTDHSAVGLPSVVAVQSFVGAALVRSGSGVVVSSDGLILTTTAAAAYGSGTAVQQVTTSRGEVLRAQWVAYDKASGLVLLKTSAADLTAVDFDATTPVGSGTQLNALGATLVLSRYTPVAIPAWVAYALSGSVRVLALDHTILSVVAGAQLRTAQGGVVGIVGSGTPVKMIPAATIDAMMSRYLEGRKGL